MEPFYTIFGKSEYAVLNADFAVVECLLQDDPKWGANVLEMSGEYDWRVKLLRRQSIGWNSSRIIPETTDHFIAFATIGKRSFLAYQIERESDQNIRVTPIGYVPVGIKVFTAFVLTLLYILPVILSPFIWKLHKIAILRSSKIHLDAFCRYLHDRLRS